MSSKENFDLESVQIVKHKVEYTLPKFWHRIIANLIDIFIFAVIGVLLFIGCRAIVEATPSYKQYDQKFTQMRLDSGLYMKNPASGEIVDVVTYLEKNIKVYGDDFDGIKQEDGALEVTYTKIGTSVDTIKKFRNFIALDGVLDPLKKEELTALFDTEYNKIRLETKYQNEPYFIEENGEIIPNPIIRSDATLRKYYFEKIYSPFIDNFCLGFLNTNVPAYYEITKLFAILILTLEVPIAYVVSAVLVFYVPGLIFKRGRKSLGKALYHIGLIDTKTVLNPSLGKYTIRFLIFLFGELILSLVTLGLPYLISFSMMAFSKRKQGFPDYMLGLQEIDTSTTSIYMDYVEAQLKEGLYGKAIDFKMKKKI